jgi:hypothetical protein
VASPSRSFKVITTTSDSEFVLEPGAGRTPAFSRLLVKGSGRGWRIWLVEKRKGVKE